MSKDASAGVVAAEIGHGSSGAARTHLALVVVALLVALALVYELAVGTRRGQRVDEAVKAWWLPARVTLEGEARRAMRLLGAPLLVFTWVASTSVVVHRRRGDALAPLAAIVIGCPLLAQFAKHLLGRTVLAPEAFPPSNTLPSGHATVIAVAAITFIWLVPPTRRAGGLWVAAMLSGGGGVTILVAATHRPSDVLAGFLLAGAWSAMVLATAGRSVVDAPSCGAAIGPAGRRLLTGGLVALAGGVSSVAMAIARHRSADDTSTPTFVGGCALIAGAAVLVVFAVGRAMGPVGVDATERWQWTYRSAPEVASDVARTATPRPGR